MAGDHLFKSGVNIGKGLTYQLDEKENANGHFMDTPGLSDKRLRKAAGEAISEGLRKDGDYKVIFFVTQEAGRVNAQDATTMKLVLDAAPEIGQNYGVVVNKIKRKTINRFNNENDRIEFLFTLFEGISEDKRCVFDRVMFFPELEKLDDEMDVLITPKELVSDKGIDWQTFVDEDVPLIKIRKENVTDVNTDGFEDMQEKLELITAELNRKDAEWKRERIEIEKKRNEEMRNLKEKMEIRRKIELQREKTTKRIEMQKMEQVHQMNRQDDTLKIQVLGKLSNT